MFLVGYKMRYAHGPTGQEGLNGVSGAPWTEIAPQSIVTGLRRFMARGRPGPASRAPRRSSLHFVVEPLKVPSIVRPSHEPQVLYVRLAAPAQAGTVAVLPGVGAAIVEEISRAARQSVKVQRAVLVGADSILDPAAEDAAGREEALAALVDAFAAFRAARLPFVWRTRGGIDGPLPHALGQALVDAGGLATVEIGVPTLDHELCTALEGHTGAAPDHRMRLATALASRGVHVRGLVDPLVPMLTDQEQSLEALMEAFADAGVHKVGARYIVLTRERARAVAARLAGMQRALLQGVFADEPWQKPDPEDTGPREVHKRIPAHLRRSGHHRLLEAGARHGVFVDILDPVEGAEDLSAEGAPEADVPPDKPRARVRRRPQLELFRRSR